MSDQTAEQITTHRREPLLSLTEAVADPRWPWATSKSQLTRLCVSGAIRHRRIGGRNWIAPADLDAYEDSQARGFSAAE